jgi:hypothetical protein
VRTPRVRGIVALSATIMLLTAPSALGAGGQPVAARFQAHASGVAVKALVYVESPSTARTLQVGLRRSSGGHIGALLSAGSMRSPRKGAWDEVKLKAIRIVAGKSYWLSVSGHGGTLLWHGAGCATVQTRIGARPSAAKLTNDRLGSCPVSAIVILSAAAKAKPAPLLAAFPADPTVHLAVAAASGEEAKEAPKEEGPKEVTSPPLDTVAPAITGSAVEGKALQASPGTWSNASSFAYQWRRCTVLGANCAAIAGATDSSYILRSSDVSHTLRVIVTATGPGGTVTATSAQSAAVVAAAPGTPTNSTAPALSGSTVEGQTLKTSNGSWTGSPTSFAYQWQRCSSTGSECVAIGGATAAGYKLTSADVGHALRAAVTASNASGSATAASGASPAVTAAIPAAPGNTALPAISGSTVEGKTLKTSNGSWSRSPTSFAYQWQRCSSAGAECATISAASASSYLLTSTDVGHTIRVVVTAKNGGGSTAATSGHTGAVTAAATGGGSEGLFISPTGKDSSACTEAAPCLTMGHTYEKAAAGESVQMLSGEYPGQTIEGDGRAGPANVVFEPAAGAKVKVTGTIYVFASHVTIEGITTQDVTVGNYDQTPGRPNPTDVSLLDLTGRNFELDSAREVTVEGGSWGPSSACGGPYGGNNNSIRQTIPSVAPENILINATVIHDVQSYNLIECHIEGLAIFAGNHVTVSNSKFYGNSVYDIFMQANSGGSPNNVTLSGNWLAVAEDNSGANGRSVGSSNGVAIGDSGIDENLTLEGNHLNDILQMDDNGTKPTFRNVKVIDNFGIMPFENYACGSLAGIEWSKNVWQNDKCGSTDVDLPTGAAMPYVKASNDSSLNYTLTGAYANWPEEEAGSGGSGSSGVLFVSGSGSDSGSCSEVAPCRSLGRAYVVAQAGEVVRVAAGLYADTSLPLTSGKGSGAAVVFEPVAGASVRFSKKVDVEAHDVELKGFTFEHELYFGENAEGVVARGNTLHNFEIIANGAKAPKGISIIGGSAGPVADGSDNENNLIATNGPETTAVPTKILIEGVLIHEYTKVGSAHVDCLQVWAGNELTVRGNTFKRCAVFDIFLQSLPNGDAGTPRNVTIENNVLEKTIEGFYSVFLPRHNEGNQEHFENVVIRNNSATQAISADPRATYTNVKIDGNIAPQIVFWNEETEVNQAAPAGVSMDYNVLYGSGAKKIGAHDQTAPAGFVSESTMNLHLTETSAAIAHGDPADFPTTDIEGNTRPNPPDAGAYQTE